MARRMPWGSLVVVLLLLGVFSVQLLAGRITPGDLLAPAVPDLVAMGGLNGDLVRVGGDWWRLFLAPLLHGSALHLTLNAAVLLYAGWYVERRLDSWTLAGLLAAGGLAGAVASLLWLPDDKVGIGASGAVMALVACAVALSYAHPLNEGRRSGRLLNILVLSLIPYESGVDYAAHFGGAVAGGLVALATFGFAPPEPSHLMRRWLATGAALGFAGCALFGLVQVARMAPAYDPDWRMLTARAAAGMDQASLADLRQARARVPGDPRLAFDLARAEALAGEMRAAEREALAGLRLLRTIADDSFAAGLGDNLKLTVALARGQAGGALCRTASDRRLMAAMRRAALCQ